jgi:hypothetical protein
MEKIHHGDTEFTEVARNDRLGWTVSKLRVEKPNGYGNDDGL